MCEIPARRVLVRWIPSTYPEYWSIRIVFNHILFVPDFSSSMPRSMIKKGYTLMGKQSLIAIRQMSNNIVTVNNSPRVRDQ